MRLSELSAHSGVSVASLKWYLREGWLPPGATQPGRAASYGDEHVARVRLIRALVDSGGLSYAAVRSVIGALDRQDVGWHELLGTAQYALSPAPFDGSAEDVRAEDGQVDNGQVDQDGNSRNADADEVEALLRRLGWRVHRGSPVRGELAAALVAAESAGVALGKAEIDAYAAAMRRVAEVDLSTVPRTSPEAALRQVVLGTVLVDPVLLALRKLAQEDVSADVSGS